MPSVPAVTSASCGRTWNSRSMVEGLRLLGACPRCGGELRFAEDGEAGPHAAGTADDAPVAPHMVLGIPRR